MLNIITFFFYFYDFIKIHIIAFITLNFQIFCCFLCLYTIFYMFYLIFNIARYFRRFFSHYFQSLVFWYWTVISKTINCLNQILVYFISIWSEDNLCFVFGKHFFFTLFNDFGIPNLFRKRIFAVVQKVIFAPLSFFQLNFRSLI